MVDWNIILIFVRQSKHNTMRKLTVSQKTFTKMLVGLIASGVTFEAEEISEGIIEITFLGGY